MGGTIKRGNPKKSSKFKQDREERKRERNCDTVAVLRGMETEDLFYKTIAAEGGNRPPWFRSVRRSLGFEDKHQETDIVVDTDYGKVCVDVKSSKFNASKTFKGENVLTLVLPLHLEKDGLREFIFRNIEAHLRRTHRHFDLFETSRSFFRSV